MVIIAPLTFDTMLITAQVMENPAMKQMAMSMMGNMMGGGGGGMDPSAGASSNGGQPSMETFLNM